MAVEAMPQMQHQNRTLEKMEIFSFAATFSTVRSSFFSTETRFLLLRNRSTFSIGGGLNESYAHEPFAQNGSPPPSFPFPIDKNGRLHLKQE
jgi:hypothetical protein